MQAIDMEKMGPFLGKLVDDLGPVFGAALTTIGIRLGLYRAMAESSGPVTAGELARKTGTHERMIQEWLCSQAASGYVEFDAQTGRFSMTPEQIAVFVDEDSPFCLQAAFEFTPVIYADLDKISAAFSSEGGFPWGDHAEGCSCATAKYFRPTYRSHLLQEWLPALDGIKERMEAGCTVGDVGCGHGISTALMAASFPKSTFTCIDYDEPSIECAMANAKEAGVSNVNAQVATSKEFEGTYDVITFFDCYHDMGDPVGVAKHALDRLSANGSVFLVEPFGSDTIQENMTPVGRMYYAASTMFCTPCAISQNGSAIVLGAQAGEKRTRDCFLEAGFSELNRMAETPFNIVYQAVP
jgi:SAM-dependent methyltransferase